MISNKKGLVGDFIVWFVAIVFIVVLLAMFTFMSGMLKTFGDEPAALVEYDEEGLESSLKEYFDGDYVVLREAEFEFRKSGGFG